MLRASARQFAFSAKLAVALQWLRGCVRIEFASSVESNMQSLRNLRPLRTIRHRNFRLLLEGALISSSGDFMQNVAQSWLVWDLTRSPFAIGVVAFFDSMPRLLVGAFGGAIADRFDRRRVLLITQTLAMIQAVIYWLAVWFGVIAFWHIVVLSFFLGIV